MSTGLSHYDRYIREVDRDSAERKYQRKEDFADVSNVVTAANSAVTFVHNLNSPTQTNKLNVFWEILGSRHDGSGDASISLEFQSGDTVTSDSIQLRVRNLGRNISVDHPMTLLVRFSRATPWILALMLLSYPSHALVDCDGAGQAINYNLTTNTFGCVSGLGGGGGAPTGASYITQVTEAGLSAEQNLAVLSSGIMFSTTGTGVVSTLVPHAGTDVTADLEEEGVTCTGCIAAAEIANDVIAPDQLSDTQTLDANLQWSMGAYTMTFTVANPASGGIDIDGTGAYTGDLLHVHQHVGNAGAGNLVHMEAADPDVTPLLHVEALSPSATGGAGSIVGILINTDDDDDDSYLPLRIADNNNTEALFTINHLGNLTLSDGSSKTISFDFDAGTDTSIYSAPGLFEFSGDIQIDNGGTMALKEPDGSGNNYLAFDTPAAVATSRTCVFEDGTDASFIPDSCVGDGSDATGLTSVGDSDIVASAVDGGAGGEIEDGTITADDLGANSVGVSELTPDPGADDQLLVSDSTSAVTWRSVPNCTNNTTEKLNYDAATNAFECNTDQTAAGATTTIYAANGSDTPITVAPTDPGTALASKAITVAAGDIVTLEVDADIMNNSGGTKTYTQRCRIASTTIVANTDSTTLGAGTTRGTYKFICQWFIRSSSSVRAVGDLDRTPTTAAGTVQTAVKRRTWNTSASNWTGAQTFALNISSSATGATQDAIVNGWKLTHQANNP